MWYKNLKYYSFPQNISYLPRDMGKMAIFDKNTTTFAVYKASKKGGYLSESVTVLYLQYRRAQLMDEDCLATPDPTTSMFLYWMNTNRMGTANNDFCNVFILKKHSFKKQIYTCELVRNLKRARQTFQCIFRYSGNLPDCPGKRTAQKKRITLKICNISCNHVF